jgi:hypothetical protein
MPAVLGMTEPVRGLGQRAPTVIRPWHRQPEYTERPWAVPSLSFVMTTKVFLVNSLGVFLSLRLN